MTGPAPAAAPAGVARIDNLAGLPLPAQALNALMAWCGVTRLASLAGLDVLGFPVVAAIRPASLSLSIASGKGQSLAGAVVSAIMEAYEHAAAERARPLVRLAPAANGDDDFADPWSLPADRRAPARPATRPIRWVAFERLSTGGAIWLPHDMVHLRLTPDELTESDGFLISTNGLAAGTCFDAAVLHALCEVIERDAIARALNKNGALRLDAIAPLDLTDCAAKNPAVAALVSALALANISITLNDLTHDIGVPVVHCRLGETLGSARLVRECDGVGCAPTPGDAICRALLEAVQARATLISGARDDILKRTYQYGETSTYVRPAVRRWADLPCGPPDAPAALTWTLARLDAAGFPDAAVLRLDERHGVVAVRVVVPGLEGVPMSAGYVPGARGAGAQHRAPGPRPVPTPTSMPVGDSTPWLSRPQAEKPIVFLGPSLPLDHARSIVEAEFLPPAGQGDLFRSALRKPPAVLLIDGTFQTGPSVWHKEILWALSEGIPVIGAASLGALRAAELTPFGMIGVGKVFDRYVADALVADDLVAVQYAPAELGYAPVTDAAVDIAATLEQAVAQHVIDRLVADAVWRLACDMHFTQRTWPRLIQALGEVLADHPEMPDVSAGAIRRFEAWLPSGKTSIKATDAKAALALLSAAREDPFPVPAAPNFTETLLWAEMMARETNPFLRTILGA